jgi:hypothetical protein
MRNASSPISVYDERRGRLCEYCKVVNHRLVISGDLLHQMTIPDDLRVGGGKSIALRGRQERIEAHAIELPAVISG